MKRSLEFLFSRGSTRWFPFFFFFFFANKKNASVKVFHSSFDLWLFFVKFHGMLLLDQKAVSLNFWALKKLWSWSACLYNMPEGHSLFQFPVHLPTSTYQWELVSSGRPSDSFWVTGPNQFFLDSPGGPFFFLNWKVERAFPGSWHLRRMLRGGKTGVYVHCPVQDISPSW